MNASWQNNTMAPARDNFFDQVQEMPDIQQIRAINAFHQA